MTLRSMGYRLSRFEPPTPTESIYIYPAYRFRFCCCPTAFPAFRLTSLRIYTFQGDTVMHLRMWLSTLEIGQAEGLHSISAIHCAEERKQRRILSDLQELPFAKRPTLGREVVGEKLNLPEIWFHQRLLCVRGEGTVANDRR